MAALLPLFALASVALALPSSEAPSVDSIFKRGQNRFNGTKIGSNAWTALYPATNATPASSPQTWLDKLAAVELAGLLPNASLVPVASLNKTSGIPSYGGLNASGPDVCSVTFGCYDAEDIVNAPDGKLTVAFDDGPDLGSPSLYAFLVEKSIHGTHFLIGRQIIKNWKLALQLRGIKGQQFAVHTWTHPDMTTLTNEQVVAELGWTMQLIADLNYGKIPGWWRHPYGDVDARVRRIAKHVFGLRTVIWNHDPKDWAIDTKTWFEANVTKSIASFVNRTSKSPGLLMLEHELSTGSAEAFISEYPTFAAHGWDVDNIPGVFGLSWYKNAFDDGSYINKAVTISFNGSLSLGNATKVATERKNDTNPSARTSYSSAPPAILPPFPQMPGHANFVGGPQARIRRLSSGGRSSSSHIARPYKPRKDDVKFDFKWAAAPFADRDNVGDYEQQHHAEEQHWEEGRDETVEEDERRENERGGKGRPQKSVVLDVLRNDLMLGGFEAGRQALLDADDWAGLKDSFISASDFFPSRLQPAVVSSARRRASRLDRRDDGHHRRRKAVSMDKDEDENEEWEGEHEKYMREELARQEVAQPVPRRAKFADASLFSLTDGNDASHFYQSQPQSRSPRQQQRHQAEQEGRFSVATVDLDFQTGRDGVAQPRTYVLSSSSDKSADANFVADEEQLEDENEQQQEPHVFVQEGGEEVSRDHRTRAQSGSTRIDASKTPSKPKLKKTKKAATPDSQRVTLGSSVIFRSSDSPFYSPPFQSPAAVGVASRQQQNKSNEERSGSNQQQQPSEASSTSIQQNDWDSLQNPLHNLGRELGLQDISGDASPLLRPPSASSRSSGSRMEMKDDDVRVEVEDGQHKSDESYDYNFNKRSWPVDEEEDEPRPWEYSTYDAHGDDDDRPADPQPSYPQHQPKKGTRK